ncbi:MAG TPA: 2-oxo-4-hydroxy-4-carboxy-5-ureidoimidazoline decarboxylase [Streptosporangiaceae bacterium]|nr:2-oxo-4-hydroxy-4-carboxy-5-ureidoimidazoline decarboxylase [Streptosporangiaceae bacterium]
MTVPSPERAGLDAFNALPADAAREHLLACCSSRRWAAEVAAGRPYASADEILARSDAAVAGLAQADLEQALAGHPRIGRPDGPPDGRSRREQAGAQAADPATLQALADGNEAYERRFGHIYLVRASGRSGAELLALLRERLGHDPAAEWEAVRRELGEINRIRLRGLLRDAGPAAPQRTAVTTHVLDTARGVPAAGVPVRLDRVSAAGPEEIGRARTDADGRVSAIGPHRLMPGTYRLTFGTAEYLGAFHAPAPPSAGLDGEPGPVFFPEVTVTFTADGLAPHYHVPLLLSPFGYTTYRGS